MPSMFRKFRRGKDFPGFERSERTGRLREFDTGCTVLNNIKIPDNIKDISWGAFYGCYGLESITVPENITTIGSYAFSDCVRLTKVSLPDSLTEMGDYVFSGCIRLKTIVIPKGLTKISRNTFSGCIRLSDVTIPDSVITIEQKAFYDCIAMTGIRIPGSVTTIGDLAFGYCSQLTITGQYASAAHEYAVENDIPFIVPDLENHSLISSTSVPQNTSVFVKGAAEGGEGGYKYAFYYKKSTSAAWQTIGELYGNTTEVSFVPASVAKYLVKVNVKDNTGKVITKIFEVNSTKPTGTDLVNKSTLNKSTTVKGQPITITGAASGGAGGYTYAFYYKKSTSKAFTAIGTEYGSAKTAAFTPGASAEYNVRINVKDSNGTIVTKQYKITSTDAGTSPTSSLTNNSTVSATEVTKGTTIFIIGNAANGTSPYKYAFYYKKSTSSSWTTIGTEFGSDSGAVFTPAVKAAYNVKVIVRDSTGKTAEKTFTITSK